MKPSRTLALFVGFAGGLLLGATSQAIRLAIVDKQSTVPASPLDDLPAFLKPDPADDTPSTGSTGEGA